MAVPKPDPRHWQRLGPNAFERPGHPCRVCQTNKWGWVGNGRPAWHCHRCRADNVIRWKQAIKEQAFNHYGRACACCGESERAFLQIDHIDGNGAEHRKTIGRGAYQIYAWLKRNEYPEGFQVLCANCNWAKHFQGACPHAI